MVVLSLRVKCNSGKTLEAVNFDDSGTVFALKAFLSAPDQADVPVERQRLIHAGRVLANERTLASYSLKDRALVHLVAGAPQSTSSPASPAAAGVATSAATPASPATPGTAAAAAAAAPPLPGLAALFGGAGGAAGAAASPFGAAAGQSPEQMAQHILANPEATQAMMESPIMQGLLNNPELMKEMLLANPQVQELIRRQPELGHVLNDPATLRQLMATARNPSLRAEAQRNADRQIANLEAMPGGMEHLQRLFSDVQQPLEEATSGGNPFASLFGGGAASAGDAAPADTGPNTQTADGPNDEPLPNPWAAGGAAGAATAGAGGGLAGLAGLFGGSPGGTAPGGGAPGIPSMPDLSALLGAAPPAAGSSAGGSSSATDAAATGGSGAPPPAGMPDLSALLGGAGGMPDPAAMQAAMQTPQMQQALQAMQANPAMFQQMLQANPMAQQMMAANPQMAQAMSDPAFIQAALGQMSAATGSGTAAPDGGAPPDFGALLAGLGGDATPGGATAPVGGGETDWATVYKTQLDQMAEMGLTDRAANLRALRQTQGNVEAAVARVLDL